MAKTFVTVSEITADGILKKIEDVGGSIITKIETGVEYLSEKVGNAIEKGSKYRVSLLDKNGEVVCMSPMLLGAFGLTLAVVSAPVVTFLVSIASLIAGSTHEYKVIFEKVVETPDVAPPA